MMVLFLALVGGRDRLFARMQPTVAHISIKEGT